MTYLSVKEATEYLLSVFDNPHQCACENGIDDSHAYRARDGDYTKRWLKLLRELGLRPTRCRISADVSPEQRAALHALAASHNMSWSEYCRMLADGEGG